MRPLHRPMFRYGGPIKEGVMSGIREPHAGGGRAALVGNPVQPQTGGREHHNWFKTILGFGTRAGAGTGAKEATKKTVGTETVKGIKSLWQKYGPTWPKATRTGQLGEGKGVWEAGKGFKEIPIPKMERAGRFVRKNPWWTAAGVAGPGQTALVKGVQEGPGLLKRGVMQIGDLLVHDSIFDQDKYFADKEKAKLDEEKKLTANELRIKELEKLLAGKDEPEVPQKTEEEIRNERIQKYRDIMDIKGMNKEAAYDSLIAASKAVGESGDFKGDIKSGKLINDIIQSTSKAFDKPKKTKDAIDTLILKGEIEKDLYAAKPSEAEKAAAAFGISKEEYKKKLLGKSSAAEYIATSHAKTGRVDSTTVASGYKASGIIPKATITDTIVDDWIDDNSGKTEIDYVKEVIAKEPDFVPGLYVVGDRAVLYDGTTYKYDY